MDTRAAIIHIGDTLLRERGYNAFSFTDISRELDIKNASVHYHFPTKASLGVAIISEYEKAFEDLRKESAGAPALAKLRTFLKVYIAARGQNKICLVGSLATDLYTVDEAMQQALGRLVRQILSWLTAILEEGRSEGMFFFSGSARTKALLVITNMMAALQLTRVTGKKDFQEIKGAIIADLIGSGKRIKQKN
ncbi:MAG: TetR/AcrR family transcriptional regulator [Niabella sp.]|nr:TetR/AcrR family transcriptional regulator [Niabella sp.]